MGCKDSRVSGFEGLGLKVWVWMQQPDGERISCMKDPHACGGSTCDTV